MPATEEFRWNQKILHIVFGATTAVMVIASVWLVAKDHSREWKDWQLKDRKKEAWSIQARRDFLAATYDDKLASFQGDLADAKAEPIDPKLVAEFKQRVVEEQSRLSGEEAGEADPEAADAEFQGIDNAVEALAEQATLAASLAAELDAAGEDAKKKLKREWDEALNEAAKKRSKVYGELQDFIDEAKRREKQLVGAKKFAAADRTAVVSTLGLKIGEGAPAEVTDKLQAKTDELSANISDLTAQIASAIEYRSDLEAIQREMDEDIALLSKDLTSLETELARLDEQVKKNTSNPLEWVTRQPVLNALYDGNVRIDQIWLPDLTINFNFSNPARFDRCKSCHQAMSKTAPGTATDPAYPNLPPEEREQILSLLAPEEAPEENATLEQAFGFTVTDEDMIARPETVTVHYVLPETPAAVAGLKSGDVIEMIGDEPMYTPDRLRRKLLKESEWGEAVPLSISRGLPHPFTSHPRLDLYLTDLSPHPEKKFGCTICHDGQGSGTEFKWTSHTPDNAKQKKKWLGEYEWFDNHHWIFPMKPARFAESNCLKCHHEKGGLEASRRYPDPPAPKLVEGWTLAEEYGCFGCHEINGYDGPDKRVGPDLRLEPTFHEFAAAMLEDDGLSDEQRRLAEQLVLYPSDNPARDALLTSIDLAAKGELDVELSEATYEHAAGLKDVETPGDYRKVGPSLRHLSSKVDYQWLYSWIRKPADFRPSTKMPQFFGLWEHLKDPEDADQLAKSQMFEPIEIRSLTKFLLDNSREFEYIEQPAEVTETASAERGKWLFESRGCLACHAHEEFEGIDSNQGPELSRIAAKFQGEMGEKWLYTWLREPHKYHSRTKMPDVYLTPIAEKDAQGSPTGKVTDPAADIAAYLLSFETDWTPTDVPASEKLSDEELEALNQLSVEWLASDTIPTARAERIISLEETIPPAMEKRLKADEKVLVGMTAANREDRLQEFVARRTIGKYGCFGCHDIPGYEGAKPIGAALAEWGRKESSKLAFEGIHTFLETHGLRPTMDSEHGHDDHGHGGHGHLDPADFDDDHSFFIQAINSHQRDGFIWQKLRYPRSYDYKRTRNKGFNERLRMPMFPFDDEQREAIITFVLGLVNEAPGEDYIYNPPPRQDAIVQGRKVLERFNCAGCHTMEMEQWKVAFSEDDLEEPSEQNDYPFLKIHFSDREVAESEARTDAGRILAELHGMPVINQETGKPQLFDIDIIPLEEDDDESDPYYMFTLWEDALVDGQTWVQGLQDILVPASRDEYGPAVGRAWKSWGGDLTNYLFPRVIEETLASGAQVNGAEAWGWLPPPLMAEGEKVQTDWLHAFLLNPRPLRPAVVMRMPNFRMSPEESAKLVNYFAATSDVEYPYEYKPVQQDTHLAAIEADKPTHLDEAMNIVTNGNYCVKCHAVADYQPAGEVKTFGPALSEVYRRLRPEYLRDWIANPKRILPYTGMPVNIPYKADAEHLGGVSQSLYEGTSLEQLGGLVDLLMNFDEYAKRGTSITPLVESAASGGDDQAKKPSPTPR